MKDYLEAVKAATASLLTINAPYMNTTAVSGCGMKHRLTCFITLLRQAMYPNAYGTEDCACETAIKERFEAAAKCLHELCAAVLGEGKTEAGLSAEDVVRLFFERLPEVAQLLRTDIRAAYEGDPAATCEDEIIYAYPSFEAVSIFRLAHLLYEMKVPLLPRMMTEFAHQNTGIDIHPGATIGAYFFIDHGTGVVIGETCVIGEHVKLYQGVTLGAKSFELDENGNPIKGIKRHPNIADRVVIYAGATILGGNTYVGEGAVIGGNVWLTRSVAAGETVTNADSRRS